MPSISRVPCIEEPDASSVVEAIQKWPLEELELSSAVPAEYAESEISEHAGRTRVLPRRMARKYPTRQSLADSRLNCFSLENCFSPEEIVLKFEAEQQQLIFIQGALRHLTPKQAEVVRLLLVNEESIHDIALMMGLRDDTVRHLEARAIARLSRYFRQRPH